jgi:Transcription factor WhiB
MSSNSITFEEYEILSFIEGFQRNRPAWYDQAECKGQPIEYFFPGVGQSALARKGQEICGACPVKEKCFRTAMDRQDYFGVWGGSLPAQRLAWGTEGVPTDEAWERLRLSEIVPDIGDA